MNLDDIFNRIKKFDSKLSREEFEKAYKKNPAGVMQIYAETAPKSIIGSQVTLPDGTTATVQEVREGAPGGAANALVTQLVTDKGVFDAYGEDFVQKGFQYSPRGKIFTPTQEHLDAIEKGQVAVLNRELFTDLNRSPDSNSDNLVLFAAPVPSYFHVSDPTGLREDNQGFKIEGLAKGENGKLYYAGTNGVSGNGQKTYSLFGERVGLPEGINARTTTIQKKGGLLGSIGRAIAPVLDNPIVKLGASFLPGGAPLVAAFEAGKVGGALASGQISFSDALKGMATAAVAQGVGKLSQGFGNAASNAIGGAAGNVASNAIQGAATGATGSLLSGGDVGKGLLSGGLFGAGRGAAESALSNLAQSNEPLGTGLNPNAKGLGLQIGPEKFGPKFDLPSTTGFLTQAPTVGGLLDGVTIPGLGIKPNARGEGLQLPSSPNIDFGSGLGQGITLGVPGGTLSQSGFTPANQVNLGDPNSFVNKPQATNTATSIPNLNKLIGGLLAGGAASGITSGLLGQGSNQQTPQTVSELPVQRFTNAPTYSGFSGDYQKYGEQDIGSFQFYRPNIGLLG